MISSQVNLSVALRQYLTGVCVCVLWWAVMDCWDGQFDLCSTLNGPSTNRLSAETTMLGCLGQESKSNGDRMVDQYLQ